MTHDATPSISRRRFLASSAAAGGASWLAHPSATAAEPTAQRVPQLCLFSKPLQSRSVAQLAEALVELNVRHVDLTVRPGGHVLPERARDELPQAKELLERAGVSIPMVTTAITSVDEPHTEDIVRTAAALGIRQIKLGYYPHKNLKAVQQAFTEAKAKLRDLVPLFVRYDVQAGFHNHSGLYVGALLWDAWELIRDLDPARIGAYFDPGHATVEGGYGGWRIGMHLLGPRLAMLAIKDFAWEIQKGKRRPGWGPIGEGTVDWPAVMQMLEARKFAGPISLHVEYGPHGKPGTEEEEACLAAIRKDLGTLRAILHESGIRAA